MDFWQYRITFADLRCGICPSGDRLADPWAYFHRKFTPDRVLAVEERNGSGEWELVADFKCQSLKEVA